MGLLKKAWAALTKYPDSWEDYIPIGRWMVYKRLPVLLLLAALFASGFFWKITTKPVQIPVFEETQAALKFYSGPAVITRQGLAVYEGQVETGLRSGCGSEYAGAEGALVYEGGFLQNQYNGSGRLYKNGALLYEGGFRQGAYDGEGTLYQKGEILYQGHFSKGVYDGYGILFAKGRKIYEGSFLNGLYDGAGVLYDGERLLYTGSFAKGKYEGQGAEFTPDGMKQYEGAFRNGKYDGSGILYHENRFRFQGTFMEGVAGPSGSIYNAQGQLLYTGPVRQGQVDYAVLPGLPLAAIQAYAQEVPTVYYSQGKAGFFYRELGFVALIRYDNASLRQPPYAIGGGTLPAGIIGGLEGTENDTDISLFYSPEDDLTVEQIMVEGTRMAGLLPEGVTALPMEMDGLEAFLVSRLASVSNPAALLEFPAWGRKRGGNLYEVADLPEQDWGQWEGLYQDTLYYFWPSGGLQKGAAPAILIGKARFSG